MSSSARLALRSFSSALLCSSLSLGCGSPLFGLDFGGANLDQRNLCGEQASEQWEELLADCRARWEEDQSCAGLLSFEGQLDGQEVLFGGELASADFDMIVMPEGDVLREAVSVAGRAPTYEFKLENASLGVPVELAADIPPYLVAPDNSSPIDFIADGSMRLSNGFQSRDIRAVDGFLLIEQFTESEYRASWEMSFGTPEDRIEGCIHALVTKTTLEEYGGGDGDPGTETGMGAW